MRQAEADLPCLRFLSLQRLRVMPRCRGLPFPATIPLRRWIFLRQLPEVSLSAKSSSLRFYALRLP